MAGVACGCVENGVTSGQLAQSVNTSPSFIRRTLAKLSKAGLLETTMGKTGACRLAREPKAISLLDIYRAVNAPKAFAIHNYAEQKACTVSCRIKTVLETALDKTQTAMESSLAKTNLAEIVSNLQKP